jgi:hypothetical protein
VAAGFVHFPIGFALKHYGWGSYSPQGVLHFRTVGNCSSERRIAPHSAPEAGESQGQYFSERACGRELDRFTGRPPFPGT